MTELERLDFTWGLIQRGRQAIPFKGTLRYWQVDPDLAQAAWEWPSWHRREAVTLEREYPPYDREAFSDLEALL